MQLELYQAETARIAAEQTALLDQAFNIVQAGKALSRLEQNGVLHAIQVLIENAIGKAKQILKASNEPVPISAYDAFDTLARLGEINQNSLEKWNQAIGLRNRIVHEYMNIDMRLILELVAQQHYQFIADFLATPIVENN